MDLNYIGIDPGATGAIALINSDTGTVVIHDIANSLQGAVLFLRRQTADGACIEKVGVMPGQGAVGAFTFGHTVGFLKGILAAFEIALVCEPRPQDWKRAVGIVLNPPKLPKGSSPEQKKTHKSAVALYKREMKTVSRNRAMELYPAIAGQLARAMDADRAEAVLLAHYLKLHVGAK